MQLLSYMNESVDCVETLYQRYATQRGKFSQKAIYCFFEGKDDPKYYTNRIERFTTKDIITYPCNGRDNVYRLHGMIESRKFKNTNNLYFTDKDFNYDILEESDIYSTPGYAIENFYILDSVFEKIIKYELGIDKFSVEKEDKEDFFKLMKYYTSEKEKFIQDTKYLNAWYSIQINQGKLIEKNNRPDLSKLKEIKESEYPYSDIDRLKELTKNYVDVTLEEIENEVNKLIINAEYNFRGKYYLHFLVKILNNIFSESNKPSGFLSKKRRVSLGISSKSLISTFCQYANTPECLLNYLENKLKQANHGELCAG